MVKPQPQCAILRRRLPINRPRVADVFAITQRPRGQRQPMPHVQLVGRMHVVRIANIDRHRHRRVGQAQRLQLLLAQARPVLFRRRLVIRNLHIQERKISHAPLPPPVLNQRAHGLVVVGKARQLAVALALIPNRSMNRKRRQRRNHRVPQHPRAPALHRRVPRK